MVFAKNDGSKWKNTITKPKPPKITDIIISNLQKKLDSKSQVKHFRNDGKRIS